MPLPRLSSRSRHRAALLLACLASCPAVTTPAAAASAGSAAPAPAGAAGQRADASPAVPPAAPPAAPPARAATRLLAVSPRQLEALGVRFAPVKGSTTAAASLSLPARVAIPPAQISVLSAPAAGLVDQLLAVTQQSVRTGETLGQLTVPSLLEGQRALVQAASQVRLAEASRNRDDALLADGIIPAARAEATRAQLLEAQAVLREREQGLALLGLGAGQIRQVLAGVAVPPRVVLTAPAGGTVIEVLASVGQRVEPGMPLARIARLDRLWLEVQVPVANAASYRPGDWLEVDGQAVRARIVSVGRTVLSESQVVELRAEVPGSASLRAGETVGVRLKGVGSAGQRWLVPAAALVSGEHGAQAYVKGTAGVRSVALRRVADTAEGVLVEGALVAGEEVAVSGVAALRAAEAASQEAR